MNRWIQKVVSFASLAGTLAVLPAGVAFAQDAQPQTQAPAGHHRHGHRAGMLGAALKLESLTPAQRSQIEQLVASRKAAQVPVRQADAQVLTVLAQQVEQAKVDEGALAPALAAKRAAVVSAEQADRNELAQLHGILDASQRSQLVDAMEARGAGRGEGHGKGKHMREGKGGGEGSKLGLNDQQRAQVRATLQGERGPAPSPEARQQMRTQRKASLDSFRGDSFTPAAMARGGKGEGGEVRMAKALIPVLTPNQRATFATQLRTRAARESGRS